MGEKSNEENKKENQEQKENQKENQEKKENKKENNEKVAQEKKKKSSKGKIIAIVVVVLAIIAGLVWGGISIYNKINEKEILTEKLQGYEQRLSNLKLANDGAEIEEQIQTCKDLLSNDDLQNANSTIEKINSLIEDLIKQNNEYVEDQISKIDAIDQSFLPQEDTDQIKSKKDEIQSLVDSESYLEVDEKIKSLLTFVTELTTPDETLTIQIKQVDVSEFPKIKLYAAVTDESGNVPEDLEQVFFRVDEKDANAEYIKKTVSKASQLDETENINIDMVMDVSGSMDGEPLTKVKNIMNSFIDSVQFTSGDLVELTTFSSNVNVNCEFTKDKSTLKSKINSFEASGLTSLYDALYLAVNRVATKSGAKCVIAFTDGLDNNSKCSITDVINQAQKYKVPIFLIGSGTGNNSDLSKIATSTGGFYKTISSITSLQDIYSQIYREQKQLYLVEYEDDNTQMHSTRNIKLVYRSKQYSGEEEYEFQPTLLVSTEDETSTSIQYGDGPEGTVVNYLKNFVTAITNKDFSKISSYLQDGSNIYNTQKEYVKKNIEEKLLSYEILDVNYSDSNNAVVSTRETYWVTQEGKLIEMLTQECKYKVTNSSGSWKLTDFDGNVNVVSRISYDDDE